VTSQRRRTSLARTISGNGHIRLGAAAVPGLRRLRGCGDQLCEEIRPWLTDAMPGWRSVVAWRDRYQGGAAHFLALPVPKWHARRFNVGRPSLSGLLIANAVPRLPVARNRQDFRIL